MSTGIVTVDCRRVIIVVVIAGKVTWGAHVGHLCAHPRRLIVTIAVLVAIGGVPNKLPLSISISFIL